MGTDLSTQIEQAAGEPVKARDGSNEVQQRPIGEMIEADKYLRKNTRKSPLAGMFRFIQKPGRPGGLR